MSNPTDNALLAQLAAKDSEIKRLCEDLAQYVAGEGEVQAYERQLRGKDAEISRLKERLEAYDATVKWTSEVGTTMTQLYGERLEQAGVYEAEKVALETKLKIATDFLRDVITENSGWCYHAQQAKGVLAQIEMP